MRTIWLEFSQRFWIPPIIDRTLFGPVLRFGWLGFGVSKHNLTDWANGWRGLLLSALKKGDEK